VYNSVNVATTDPTNTGHITLDVVR
jgi:hypothetical protein